MNTWPERLDEDKTVTKIAGPVYIATFAYAIVMDSIEFVEVVL